VTVAHCPLCGHAHAACGPATTVTGLDLTELRHVREAGVTALALYAVNIGGNHTVMNLSAEEAARLGATPLPDPGAPVPASPPAKGRTPANKAREAESK
jgi:hypothetical protein